MTTPADTTLGLVNAWTQAFLDKDIALAQSIIAGDIVVELPFSESGRTQEGFFRCYTGRDEVLDFMRTAFAAEKTLKVFDFVPTPSADGHTVFVECRCEVVMATGAEYNNRYVMRYDAHGGKLTRVREYYNPIVSAIAFGRPIAGQITLAHA